MTNSNPKWQTRHGAVLKYMLEKPSAKQQDIAEATGYSRSHISRIVCSDDFRMRHRQLMSAHLLHIVESSFT